MVDDFFLDSLKIRVLIKPQPNYKCYIYIYIYDNSKHLVSNFFKTYNRANKTNIFNSYRPHAACKYTLINSTLLLKIHTKNNH